MFWKKEEAGGNILLLSLLLINLPACFEMGIFWVKGEIEVGSSNSDWERTGKIFDGRIDRLPLGIPENAEILCVPVAPS